MSQTRRLAAILAADIASYSRLIGADEGGRGDPDRRAASSRYLARKLACAHGSSMPPAGSFHPQVVVAEGLRGRERQRGRNLHVRLGRRRQR